MLRFAEIILLERNNIGVFSTEVNVGGEIPCRLLYSCLSWFGAARVCCCTGSKHRRKYRLDILPL